MNERTSRTGVMLLLFIYFLRLDHCWSQTELVRDDSLESLREILSKVLYPKEQINVWLASNKS